MGVVLSITLALAFIVTLGRHAPGGPGNVERVPAPAAALPPENRRRGLIGGALTLVWIVVGSTLSIIAPWGPNSLVWVVIVGGGGIALLASGAGFVQALGDIRRARRRRSQGS